MLLSFDGRWPQFAPAFLEAIMACLQPPNPSQTGLATATPATETSQAAEDGCPLDEFTWDSVNGLQWLAFMFSVALGLPSIGEQLDRE